MRNLPDQGDADRDHSKAGGPGGGHDGGGTGRRWERLVDLLAEAAITQMRRDLRTGQIFRYCAQRKWALYAPDMWADADHDAMVQDMVIEALTRFLQRCRDGDGWDPQRGSTLNDYFLGLCRGEFPNVFRRWLRQRARNETELSDDAGTELPHTGADTARAAPAMAALDEIRRTVALPR